MISRNITLTVCCLLAGAGLAAVPEATVGRAEKPPVIDGKLDDACWKGATWLGDFQPLRVRAKNSPPVLATKFAIAADADAVYVAVRCPEPDMAAMRARPDVSLWVTDAIEFFFAPDGREFNFYHFAFGPNSKDVCAEFYSEGGTIQPDPYAPKWSHATDYGETEWTCEIAVPYSAFYMTRNADWKGTWRVNVCRTSKAKGFAGYSTWAQMQDGYKESKDYGLVSGFPMRNAADDIVVKTVLAETDSAADGMIHGKLKLDVWSGVDGTFAASSSAGGTTAVTLKKGANEVLLPCAYKENGRFRTHVALTAGGRTVERDYPVMVDYQPIRIDLAKPAYRGNFYPGQDASRVAGTVAVQSGADATVVLEGPGFPRRELALKGGKGAFDFDTTGFKTGDATLTVTAGGETATRRIRNLPPTGHRMAWIENGCVVVDGKPTLRRNIYAQGYKQGTRFMERFRAEAETFRLTTEFSTGSIAMSAEQERNEGMQDRPLGEARKRELDKYLASMKDRDFVAYYIADEPECRNLSPIYLKSVYEYVAEKDPYHLIFMASRGGKDLSGCADWFETHPYLGVTHDAQGNRTYNTHPRDVGRFIENFGVLDRPDKCVGFLPTCFAYRWTSILNDYPTLDEYILHVWSAFIHGAKTLWPYAGHDIGDRPALFHGCRYVFQQAEAYAPFILHGTRRMYPRENDVDRATWTLGDETLDVSVDYKTMRTAIKAPAKYEANLETYASVAARVAAEEKERTSRDNQLLERYDDITVKSNMDSNWGGQVYKLVDGVRDFLARNSSGRTDPFVELRFAFRPRFTTVRLWGLGLDVATVSVPDGDGWRKLTPKDARHEKWMTELDFGEAVEADGLRLEFPGKQGAQNVREVYEIELPRMND